MGILALHIKGVSCECIYQTPLHHRDTVWGYFFKCNLRDLLSDMSFSDTDCDTKLEGE